MGDAPAIAPAPATTDLSDAYAATLAYLAPHFRDYGGVTGFCGEIVTLRTYEDNTQLRALLETPGAGRVIVVDGAASPACALFGGNLAELGAQNGWAGVVINGYVRDTGELLAAKIGVKALGTHPKKSEKRGIGDVDVMLKIDGADIYPGDWLYADADGVIISAKPLSL
jgi:regulator of ribonuclease activity A